MYVAPSLLAADFSNLREEVYKVNNADMLHIDIMDGVFVPNISIGASVVKALRDKTELVFDVHLMLIRPLPYIRDFASAGADIISFHPECADDTRLVIQEIQKYGKRAGLAIKPSTDAAEVFPYAEDLYMVTVMSVEPGFGGQELMPETLHKVKEIKRKYPHLLIELDGGVNHETLSMCKKAGADILVAGTAIFGAENPSEEIAYFRR